MAETPIDPTQAAPQDAVPPASDDAGVQQALADAQASIDAIKDDFDSGSSGTAADAASGGIDLLSDVDLHVAIELGRTEMIVEDVLKLNQGSVVELDKLAGDPVDVLVNGRMIARGEVLVLNDNFCIRISEIVANLEESATEAAEISAAES